MCCRLPITSAVRTSPPPAGISGWCMCSALAKALLMRPKSMRLSARKTGLPAAAAMAPSTSFSAPLMLGRPSMVSGRLLMCSSLMFASLMADHFVNVQVVLARPVPRVVAAHALHGQLAELIAPAEPQTDGPIQGRLQGGVVRLVEDVAVTLVLGPVGIVPIEDRVRQAAHRPHHGHRAVAQSDHLGEAAGLEEAGHDQDVGACVDQVRQFLVVADLEVAIRVVVEMVLELPEKGIDAWFRTGAQQDELGALVQAAEDSVMDEMHPLLLVQAAHVGHEGLV